LGDHVGSVAPSFTGTVTFVYQEHGLATCDGEWPWDELPIGARVRILPNHACLTAAAHDRYHVLDGGTLVATWERCRGW
jgi:D-serine deaminase-like pyridoxal phosphate-dependent protein